MKKIILIVLCAVGICAYADDVRKPDYQLADHSFFDPTRKKAAEAYHFGVEYRLELAYVQKDQRSQGTYPGMYMHGARLGGTFTFLLPIHFSLQTGLFYTFTYGHHAQHWPSMAETPEVEYIQHRVMEHQLTIPVKMYYTVPLWRKLNLFFFTGPQLHIGLAQNDYLQKHLSPKTEAWLQTQNIPTEPYDRMDSELMRANIQWGLGGGLEWDRYRLQAGYDFGLNNLVRTKLVANQQMWEWGWYVSFGYRF